MTPTRWSRWSPWFLRLAWIATGVIGAATLDAALEDRSDAMRTVVQISAGVGWLLGVISMAIPATFSLTATRVVVPLSVPVTIVAAAGGAPAIEIAGSLVAAALATALALSSEVGHAFVQASAYGDEERFPLRAPFGYSIAAVLAWLVWAASVVAAPLLLAARVWIPGAIVTALAIAVTVFAVSRWHLLTRRWLVLVPAGLVLHDPIVLAETLMLPRSQVANLRLAPADTGALDLTGPASGHVVEVSIVAPVSANLARTRANRAGKTIDVEAFLAAPSRPGRILLAARERGLPVG